MCYPIAFAIAAAALSAVGTAASASAQSQQANYQAQVAHNNQVIAADQARAALDAGTVRAQQQLSAGDQRMGAIRAAMGANNVQLNSGSALDLQADSGRTTALNAYTTQYNAGLQAQGFRAQGSNFAAQAQLDTMRADNISAAAPLGVASSLLNSGSNFAPKWSAWQLQAGSAGAGSALPGYGDVY